VGALALAGLMAMLLATFLSGDEWPGLEPVPDTAFVIAKPGYYGQVRRVTGTSETEPFAAQSEWPSDSGAQFHFEIDVDGAAGAPSALYLPWVAGTTRVALNNIPLNDFAMTDDALEVELERSKFQPRDNRIDIVQDPAPAGIGIALPYLVYGAEGRDSVIRIGEARGTLGEFLRWAAWLGLIASLAGLLLGGHRLAFSAGLLGAASALVPPAFAAMVPVQLGSLRPDPWLAAAGLATGGLFVVARRPMRSPLGTAASALGLLCMSGPLALLAAEYGAGSEAAGIFPALYLPAALAVFLAAGPPALLANDGYRFLRLYRESEAVIEEQGRVIEAQEMALHEQISQKAILQERQRFVRDIHDGIGGQLLSLLLRARSGMLELDEVEDEIQRGLTDLRLVVDSLDQVGNDLESALAVFYTRSRQQLEAANIKVDWTQSGELGTVSLGARQILSLYRILQEAISNSVRHSCADRLEIAVHQAAGSGALEITISDNGTSFDASATNVGKGMNNMRSRARQLGADLQWECSDRGTVVRLTLPGGAPV